MSQVIIEDQDPIMRRAKIRVVVAIVLMGIALGSLIKISLDQPGRPDKGIKMAATARPVPAAKEAAASSAPTPPQTHPDEAVQPPVAPPEPVYQSFTAAPPSAPQQVPLTPAVVEQPALAQPQEKTQTPIATVLPQSKADKENKNQIIKTSLSGTYILQVGVFGDAGNARKQLDKLSGNGIPAHSESKLWIGPFATEQDAANAREAIAASGLGIAVQDGAVSSSKGLMLLGGVHENMEHALALRNGLVEHGFSARAETRVLVGPFDTKEHADKARNKIKRLNISVVMVRAGR